MKSEGLGVILGTLTFIIFQKFTISDHMDGFIVGGNVSIIEEFPHVVFVQIKCIKNVTKNCGASIINQRILLTAAHCLILCKGKTNFTIEAYTGSVTKFKGHLSKVTGIRIHEHYIHNNYTNDVAMMVLEDDLQFGAAVKRILLMRRQPKYTSAKIAGWGRISDDGIRTNILMHTDQLVMSNEECRKKMPGIPLGTICGYNPSKTQPHPQRGDSGSALVVNKNIQIGIASFYKVAHHTTLVYTNVSYFYDWILNTAHDMFCKYVMHNETNFRKKVKSVSKIADS